MSPILEASILEAQQRGVEIGRLRMGAKVTTKNGREAPAKLAEWRLTSPSRDAITAAAAALGGEAKPWKSPTGPQWEVYSEAASLDVIVPPGEAVEQWFEMWSGGGCQRRCTGAGGVNQISGKPCECPADPIARRDLAASGRACKPTTRLRVALPTLPGIGVWRVESHGFYAAVELVGRHSLLQQAADAGVWIPARLRLEQRQRAGKQYGVPVLDIGVSMAQIHAGHGVGPLPALLGAGADERAALPPSRPAIEAAAAVMPAAATEPEREPAPGHEPSERALAAYRAAQAATSRDTVAKVIRQAVKEGLMDEWVPGAPDQPDITLADALEGQLERFPS